MKTWTMPRVHVEAFFANEYVSACQGTKPIPATGTYAADIYHDRNDRYGTGDTFYNGAAFEGFSNGRTPTAMRQGGYNLQGVWFTNVQFYEVVGDAHSDMSYESNPNVFVKYDVYDFYVTNRGVTLWAYPAGTHTDDPDFDPETKPYS